VESSGEAVKPAAQRSDGALRVTQTGVLVASLGAALVVFTFLGLTVLGLVLAVAGAVAAAPGGLGHRWFVGVGGGAALVLTSRLVAEVAEALGGWMALVGSLAILISAALGYPVGDDGES